MDMSPHDAEPVLDADKMRARAQQTTGDMLYQVFPKKVADKIKAGQKVEPETHENVTIFFSDIVRFTDISRMLSAEKVCDMLDRLYVVFDGLANKHEVFKVETIGDAWMGVTNCEFNFPALFYFRLSFCLFETYVFLTFFVCSCIEYSGKQPGRFPRKAYRRVCR